MEGRTALTEGAQSQQLGYTNKPVTRSSWFGKLNTDYMEDHPVRPPSGLPKSLGFSVQALRAEWYHSTSQRAGDHQNLSEGRRRVTTYCEVLVFLL